MSSGNMRFSSPVLFEKEDENPMYDVKDSNIKARAKVNLSSINEDIKIVHKGRVSHMIRTDEVKKDIQSRHPDLKLGEVEFVFYYKPNLKIYCMTAYQYGVSNIDAIINEMSKWNTCGVLVLDPLQFIEQVKKVKGEVYHSVVKYLTDDEYENAKTYNEFVKRERFRNQSEFRFSFNDYSEEKVKYVRIGRVSKLMYFEMKNLKGILERLSDSKRIGNS